MVKGASLADAELNDHPKFLWEPSDMVRTQCGGWSNAATDIPLWSLTTLLIREKTPIAASLNADNVRCSLRWRTSTDVTALHLSSAATTKGKPYQTLNTSGPWFVLFKQASRLSFALVVEALATALSSTQLLVHLCLHQGKLRELQKC